MNISSEPFENDYEPDGFEPLDLDDNEDEDEDPYAYEDPYEDDGYAEYEDDGSGLGGFDDLKPFGSFNDDSGWLDHGWDDGFF